MKGFIELFISCDDVYLKRSQLFLKYLNKNEEALNYILELLMNPNKDRVSSKFRKLN